MTGSNDGQFDPSRMKRKFGWRGIIAVLLGICFLIAALVAVAGAVSMSRRGFAGDDIWFAVILTGAFTLIGGLIAHAAVKYRAYVDDTGTVLPYVVMAQLIGNDSFGADGGDDFD